VICKCTWRRQPPDASEVSTWPSSTSVSMSGRASNRHRPGQARSAAGSCRCRAGIFDHGIGVDFATGAVTGRRPGSGHRLRPQRSEGPKPAFILAREEWPPGATEPGGDHQPVAFVAGVRARNFVPGRTGLARVRGREPALRRCGRAASSGGTVCRRSTWVCHRPPAPSWRTLAGLPPVPRPAAPRRGHVGVTVARTM
jgi:hypothetical protein